MAQKLKIAGVLVAADPFFNAESVGTLSRRGKICTSSEFTKTAPVCDSGRLDELLNKPRRGLFGQAPASTQGGFLKCEKPADDQR